jgi:hypothetical protein
MPVKVAYYESGDVVSAPIAAGQAAGLIEGVCIGLNASGYAVPAVGGVVPRGIATHSAARRDGFGNVIQFMTRLSFTDVGRVGGLSGIVPGAPVYNGTSGVIAASGTTRVGWGVDTTTVRIDIDQ